MKKTSLTLLHFCFVSFIALTSCSSQSGSKNDSGKITVIDNAVTLMFDPSSINGRANVLIHTSGKMEMAIETREGQLYVRANGQWNRVMLAEPKKIVNSEIFPDTDGGIFVTAQIENAKPGHGSLRNFDVLIFKLDAAGNLQKSFGRNGSLVIDHDDFVEFITSIRLERDTLVMLVSTSVDIDKQQLSVVKATAPWTSNSVSVTPFPIHGHFFIEHQVNLGGKIVGVLVRSDPKDTYGVSPDLPRETILFSIDENKPKPRIDSLLVSKRKRGFSIYELLNLGEDGVLAVTQDDNDSVSLWNAFKINHELQVDTQFFHKGYLYPKDISMTDPFVFLADKGVIYILTFSTATNDKRTLKIESIPSNGTKNFNPPIAVASINFRSNHMLRDYKIVGGKLLFVTSSSRPSEAAKPILHTVDLTTGVYSFEEQWMK